jgi:RND superfamily putative drug exporter
VKPILAAVPVMNIKRLLPGSEEDGTTVVTFLFTAPDATYEDQLAAVDRFVANYYDADDAVVGVTGSVPAKVAQGQTVLTYLPWLELVTVLAVFLIIAGVFRSIVAPLLALAAAGVATLLTLHSAARWRSGWTCRCRRRSSRCWWRCCSES